MAREQQSTIPPEKQTSQSFSAPTTGNNATAARDPTLSMYVDCRTPVLLQTAKAATPPR